MIDTMRFFKPVNENKLGVVGGSRENPTTSAPQLHKMLHNQDPLNPVCPVTNTFLPL